MKDGKKEMKKKSKAMVTKEWKKDIKAIGGLFSFLLTDQSLYRERDVIVASGYSRQDVMTAKVTLEMWLAIAHDSNVGTEGSFAVVVKSRRFKEEDWMIAGRTDAKQGMDAISFDTKIPMDFYFEEIQSLRLELHQDSQEGAETEGTVIGVTETTLSEIVTSKGRLWHGDVRKERGEDKNRVAFLSIRAEPFENTNALVTMQFHASGLEKKSTFRRASPFLRILREKEDGSYQPTFRTEALRKKSNPMWSRIDSEMQRIAGGDVDTKLKIEILHYDSGGSHKVLGECKTSMRELQEIMLKNKPEERRLALGHPKKHKKGHQKLAGQLHIDLCTITPRHSILDYLSGGCELAFSMAIDFGASNGIPGKEESLHHVDPQANSLNMYQRSIVGIGQVLQNYSSRQEFALYGFGGQLGETQNAPDQLFALNGRTGKPTVNGIDGILRQYIHSQKEITPSKKSCMADTVRQFAEMARKTTSDQKKRQRYNVGIILTNGEIHDYNETAHEIVKASKLPLSIIIIGVGKGDFSLIKQLEGNEEPIVDPLTGFSADRDIVHVVPTTYLQEQKQFEHRLAKEVLDEVPAQLTTYYAAYAIKPMPPSKPQSMNIIRSEQTKKAERYPSTSYVEPVPPKIPVRRPSRASPKSPSSQMAPKLSPRVVSNNPIEAEAEVHVSKPDPVLPQRVRNKPISTQLG